MLRVDVQRMIVEQLVWGWTYTPRMRRATIPAVAPNPPSFCLKPATFSKEYNIWKPTTVQRTCMSSDIRLLGAAFFISTVTNAIDGGPASITFALSAHFLNRDPSITSVKIELQLV